jgi:hypothetical protein
MFMTARRWLAIAQESLFDRQGCWRWALRDDAFSTTYTGKQRNPTGVNQAGSILPSHNRQFQITASTRAGNWNDVVSPFYSMFNSEHGEVAHQV